MVALFYLLLTKMRMVRSWLHWARENRLELVIFDTKVETILS